MLNYYRRDGTPYPGVQEWAEASVEERRVAETILADGTWISTIWLGLDHNFGDGPPLIFETMVFPSKENLEELDMERYPTEEEALMGHTRMVAKWTGMGVG